MPYTPTDWVDNTTPVNAANMDKLEQGVVDAHAGLPPSPAGQDGKWLTVSGGAMVWQALPASGIQASIVDAKGDLIAASAADTVARLGVGSNGQVLTADSPSALGVKWAAPPASGIQETVVDAKGDLLAASAADAVARLPVGANDQVLTADSAQALGVKWAAPSAAGTFIPAAFYPGPAGTPSNQNLVVNQAYLVPIAVSGFGSITFTAIRFAVTIVDNNIDVGVYYTDNLTTFTRIASSGAITPGATGAQVRAVSGAMALQAGRKFFLGMAGASTSQIHQISSLMLTATADGYIKASSMPLPATISSPTVAAAYVPIMALQT